MRYLALHADPETRVQMAREAGIFPTAKALHLEYGKLRQRAGSKVRFH